MDTIKTHFGEIKITRGKKHTFLGMNIQITEDKKIEIKREDQLMEAIKFFGEELEGKVTSPAQHHLFQVNEDSKILDKNKKEIFHSVTAKLLYLVNRARPDLETLVSFLTMRVTKSDVDNWKKLKRGLTFVKNTIKD